METKLREMIKEAMIAKMKNKDTRSTSRYQTLKNILETAQKICKDRKLEMTDSMLIEAARKEIKQLNDLLEYCEPNTDKYEDTKYCVSVAEELLPTMASEADIRKVIEDNKLNNMGAIMKTLKATFGDSLDNKFASTIAREYC